MQGRGWGEAGGEEMVEAQFTRDHQNHLEIHEGMNLAVILVLSSELSLKHFFISSLTSASALHESQKKIHLISASIHDRKFFLFKAQPCMNQAKKLSIVLSLNIWQEKKFNWTSALNELVHFLDSESQSQPWKKIIHDPVSISICYRGGKIWKISVSLRNFFLSSIHSRLREDKK